MRADIYQNMERQKVVNQEIIVDKTIFSAMKNFAFIRSNAAFIVGLMFLAVTWHRKPPMPIGWRYV